MSSWKAALLALARRAKNSLEVCSVVVTTVLPLVRAWGGSRCHCHPDRPRHAEGAAWKRQDILKELLHYHCCTISFASWILTTAASHLFHLCDVKVKKLSPSSSFALSVWQTAGTQMLIFFIPVKVNLCALLMVCMWDWLPLFKKKIKLIGMLPGFVSFRPARRSYPSFSASPYCEAARSKRCDLHVVLTMFSACHFVRDMQSQLCLMNDTHFRAANILTVLNVLHICSSTACNSAFICYMLYALLNKHR